MATDNSMSTMVGNFKEIYGERIIDLAPNTLKLSKRLSFQYATALGNKYHQPVDLAMEHGVTYAAANASNITLLDPNAGEMQDAQVEGAQVFARSRVDYESMYRANAAGKKAFAEATQHVVKRLTKAASKRLEISTLHGRRGIGALASVTGSSTTRAWVVTDATWAAGIWAGSKNMTLDVFAADYSGTKVNSNAKVVVTSVDLANKTINVSGNATDLTAVVAGMHLFPETSSPTNDFAGIDAIIRNTSTLFNLSASTYELWKGQVVSSVGRPTMQGFLSGVRQAVELGLESDMLAVVSPKCFEVLNSDVAALRRFDGSYEVKEGVNGVENIKYHGQSGTLEIMPHLFQKDGQAHLIATEEWKRIGATDLTFITRGANGEEKLILELPNSPSSEMRCYFNGAVFCEAPARAVVLDGITYT
jgi:hypothetical protein